MFNVGARDENSGTMLTMQGAKRRFAGRIPKRRLGTTG